MPRTGPGPPADAHAVVPDPEDDPGRRGLEPDADAGGFPVFYCVVHGLLGDAVKMVGGAVPVDEHGRAALEAALHPIYSPVRCASSRNASINPWGTASTGCKPRARLRVIARASFRYLFNWPASAARGEASC